MGRDRSMAILSGPSEDDAAAQVFSAPHHVAVLHGAITSASPVSWLRRHRLTSNSTSPRAASRQHLGRPYPSYCRAQGSIASLNPVKRCLSNAWSAERRDRSPKCYGVAPAHSYYCNYRANDLDDGIYRSNHTSKARREYLQCNWSGRSHGWRHTRRGKCGGMHESD